MKSKHEIPGNKYKLITVPGGQLSPVYPNDVKPSNHQYLDGSLGGWNSTSNCENKYFNLYASNRKEAGHEYGKKYAKEILESLHRTHGVLDESLKIVSHSMGGAYSKGFVEAIIEFAKAHPNLSNGLIISEFDFDPFQAGELTAEPKVHTEQYTHKLAKNRGKWYNYFNPYVNIADERQGGLYKNNPDGDNNSYKESSTETSHAITTFVNDILKLEEGT